MGQANLDLTKPGLADGLLKQVRSNRSGPVLDLAYKQTQIGLSSFLDEEKNPVLFSAATVPGTDPLLPMTVRNPYAASSGDRPCSFFLFYITKNIRLVYKREYSFSSLIIIYIIIGSTITGPNLNNISTKILST